MTGTIANVLQLLAANRTSWRRARNLRTGARRQQAASPARQARAFVLPRATRGFWIAIAGGLFALAGALVLVSHAQRMWNVAAALEPGAADAQLDALQPMFAGAALHVPGQGGVELARVGTGHILTLTGMRALAPVRVDLCAQMADPHRQRLLPVRIGYRFEDVARWAGTNSGSTLRNLILAGPGTRMPVLEIGGTAVADFARAGSEPLWVLWHGQAETIRWIGDDGAYGQGQRGQAALRQEGWLLWPGDGLLHVIRRASAGCTSGELLVQLYRLAPGASRNSMVVAFPAQGAARTVWLPPGDYQVPAAPAARLEDQALFEQLLARGLVRLGSSGLVELAPPDLGAYLAAPDSRAEGPAGWESVQFDDEARQLLAHLYHRADGDYVREQVRVFNSERRLLAWRVRAPQAQSGWQASISGAPVAVSVTMPAASARLFARLPEGWLAWQRVADWPGQEGNARLTLTLPQPASGNETLDVLLAGRLESLEGARLAGPARDVCTGRGCAAPNAVQQLALRAAAGSRSITLVAAPLDMAALAAPGDQRYRHLRVENGQLTWQALPYGERGPRPAMASVVLADRNGAALWSDARPTAQAQAAGLAPLLGLRAGHANSIAGMLARVPAASGAHQARLSLDLNLQAASQAALDCVGMRRGRVEGANCTGASVAPEGREAGIVIIDTETGDVLAAAGAGNQITGAADWSEVRDFDRADPARSPLRLPALQHDGGAHRSPGSTFKLISALGLELAAQRDSGLDALLGGMPLAQLNRMALDNGFGFRTDAAVYPAKTTRAHITNFRDQGLDRRAENGRLGLAQALTYSLNTWFAWTAELSDRSLFGRPDGGAPDLQALEPEALAGVRPIVEMAHRLGFEQPLRLDGGLLPADFRWSAWDALQATPAHIDPVRSRHELRQLAIGLRMQVTPLQMALAAGAVGQGRLIQPRLLLSLDGVDAATADGAPLPVRLDRIRAGLKGVIDTGTAAGAFRDAEFASLRRGLYGKTGTAPTGMRDPAGRELATVWFTGWLEPGSLPGQTHRWALAAFASHSEATGGEHAAPIVAGVLRNVLRQSQEQQPDSPSPTRP
ncbi:penicillin-binding transpeptidase domain-containing protein [Massilia horti]|uniref:beta-lactamase n=1 Tax=Massilia horti TaxID=2562153 RepID=A0A4Y9T2Y1_9BURK|nr:penicillin-binding transpeptidase domain-containing protein [Massilia horti]TFW31866.1 hypothetical protein E4O92_12125 [Massilia horti]